MVQHYRGVVLHLNSESFIVPSIVLYVQLVFSKYLLINNEREKFIVLKPSSYISE